MNGTAIALAALLAAAAISAGLAPWLIKSLRQIGMQTFHQLREDVDNRLFFEMHQKKIGTPAMGGLLMLVIPGVLAPVLFPSTFTYIAAAAILLFALLGLADDVSKARVKAGLRSHDLGAKPKFVAQWLFGGLIGAALYVWAGRSDLAIPAVGSITLGWLYIPLAALVLVTTANAANITDGLDGLAGGLSLIALSAFMAIALGRGQLAIAGFAALLAGATLGYLFYNVHPAKMFMGDVGSMALGSGMAVVALMLNSLVPLLIAGGVFAVELLSSLAQTIALRQGRRIFKIAPLHHHLEAIGWPEERVTQTFWLIGAVLAFAAVTVAQF